MWFSTRNAQKIKDIEDRVEKLERSIKTLQWEWSDAYDKMRTLTARFVKRAERIEQSEHPEGPANASHTGAGTATAHLDPVSKRILARRARLFSPPPESGTSEEETGT